MPKIGTDKNVDVLSRSTDKPRMNYCEDKMERISTYIRALQGHSHGVAINPGLFFLKQILLNWKEHTPHGELFQP